MHLNSTFVTLAWEQFEPQEGVYDYTLVDAINLASIHLYFSGCIFDAFMFKIFGNS